MARCSALIPLALALWAEAARASRVVLQDAAEDLALSGEESGDESGFVDRYLALSGQESEALESEALESEAIEKEGSGDNFTIQVSFKDAVQGFGNDIGRLEVNFPSGRAVHTNQGFAQGQTAWPVGSILGKADNYVWPIPPQGPGFTFDHGASDLVFGDVSSGGGMYRPEFEEIVYGTAAGSAYGGYGHRAHSPQEALQMQLREEQKESTLTLGRFEREGYFDAGRGAQFRYSPRLRLKEAGEQFKQLGKASTFSTAELVRPSILDIDNLFDAQPLVPQSFPSAMEVNRNPLYGTQPGYSNGGRQPGYSSGGPGYGYNNGGAQYGGGAQPGYNSGGAQYNNGGAQYGGGTGPGYHGGAQPGHSVGAPYNNGPGYGGGAPHGAQPGYSNGGAQPWRGNGNPQHVGPSRCFPASLLDTGRVSSAMRFGKGKTCKGRCTTPDECRALGGKWKAKYCAGGQGCGCCKEIGMYRRSLAETGATVEAVSQVESETEQPPLWVDMRVTWLTPVLQKFRCVSVGDQYAKIGGSPLYIAMGWDTESGVANLDIDLSLVAIDGKKKSIGSKMVYYQQQRPPALQCGYGNFAMRAFGDDRSGDEPGDDELLKLDLACLSAHHPDVEAVVVMVNIFAPQQLTWSNIDSAYLRIISGGQEISHRGNHFIRNSEAVRSYVRLSGNNLKRDPSLQKNGLAVGMFFRQPKGNWAFATLMKGLPGRAAPQSAPYLEQELRELVYPANPHWDETEEQESAMAMGAFGQNGFHAEDTVRGLVKKGQLPCIASRKDQALLMLGHMTPEGLDKVAQNPKIPPAVKNLAEKVRTSSKTAKVIRGLATAVDKMEETETDAGREDVAKSITSGKVEIAPPTAEESAEAEEDLDDLFDDLY